MLRILAKYRKLLHPVDPLPITAAGFETVEVAGNKVVMLTPDQVRAIEEVKSDMEQSKPMDRLICGDVGYGKTEVALRAGAAEAVLIPDSSKLDYDRLDEAGTIGLSAGASATAMSRMLWAKDT